MGTHKVICSIWSWEKVGYIVYITVTFSWNKVYTLPWCFADGGGWKLLLKNVKSLKGILVLKFSVKKMYNHYFQNQHMVALCYHTTQHSKICFHYNFGCFNFSIMCRYHQWPIYPKNSHVGNQSASIKKATPMCD